MTSRNLVAVLALVAASPALAAQAHHLSVEELARGSDAVVRGRVVGVTASWSDDGRRIFSQVELEVAAAWRGAAPRRSTLVVPGGVVDGIGQRVDGAPEFVVGEEVVLFLTRTGKGGFQLNSLGQGKFKVEGAAARPEVEHTVLLPKALRAGERRAEAMPVSELERRVRSVP